MLNQTMRFTSLASNIDKIYPPRDGFRVLFFRICIESLQYISGERNADFYARFERCFSEKGKQLISDGFRLIYVDKAGEELCGLANVCLTIDDFLNVLRAIRNNVVHDGEFWNTQVFSINGDKTCQLLSELTTKDKILSGYNYSNEGILTYHFETTLVLEEFTHYFIEACLNYVKNLADDYSRRVGKNE